jgi:prephenate dehydrogenase
VNFQKICIIGTGLIGGSLALAFKHQRIGECVWGVDLPEVVREMQSNSIVDQGFSLTELDQVIPEADLIILATPIQKIMEFLPQIARLAHPGALVTDVGSTKSKIVEYAQTLFHHGSYFLGGHPMAGSERRGFLAADPFLFENCYFVLTPQAIPGEFVSSYSAILEKIGAKVLLLEAAVHDRIAAGVSHLPQMLAVTLVNLMGNFQQQNPYYLKMAAGGFRDMTRIASSPFSIWEDICRSNRENILSLIDSFIAELEKMKTYFQFDAKNSDLHRVFETAARTRLSIPHDTKGFLKPLYDLTVVVRDEPGVIARISTACASKGINIRDIEVLKVRLWEGGTIRLAFESESDRLQAKQLLEESKFECLLKI